MLKVKRSHDVMMDCSSPPPCAPFNAETLFRQPQPPALKRMRRDMPSYAESEFCKPVSYQGDVQKYITKMGRRNRRRKVRAGEHAATLDYIFTEQEVREILERGMQEREEKLREEYDNILAQRLAEQLDAFNRFSEDYITSKLKKSEHNYMC